MMAHVDSERTTTHPSLAPVIALTTPMMDNVNSARMMIIDGVSVPSVMIIMGGGDGLRSLTIDNLQDTGFQSVDDASPIINIHQILLRNWV